MQFHAISFANRKCPSYMNVCAIIVSGQVHSIVMANEFQRHFQLRVANQRSHLTNCEIGALA